MGGERMTGMGTSSDRLYDRIGSNYRALRQPEPRIHAQIVQALGTAERVVNVGAGTGNYEPTDRVVVAVEPSKMMVGQRLAERGPAVMSLAEALPFADLSFDVALATFALHHWSDLPTALSELARVAQRQVILMNDRRFCEDTWIYDYFPQMLEVPSEQRAPTVAVIKECLRVVHTEVVPVPADCIDGFCGAFWSRPEALLNPAVRAGSSSLAQLDPETASSDAKRLLDDLRSGSWDTYHGHLRQLEHFDMGYRLLICGK
jgi:ubiquinone/menaquinone biosynthesis C-methylase UbiE